jgi:transposase
MSTLYVGIDVAAKSAAIHWQQVTGQPSDRDGACSIAQTQRGYRSLHRRLSVLAPVGAIHVVMEATGNY